MLQQKGCKLAGESEEKDYINLVKSFLMENPNKVYSPKQISEKLNIGASTTRSSLSRLVLYEKDIRRLRRGKYYYGEKPLTEGQRKLPI